MVIILEKYNREIEKHCRILLACAYMILLSIYLLYKGFGEGIFGNVFMKFTNPVRYDIDIYLVEVSFQKRLTGREKNVS